MRISTLVAPAAAFVVTMGVTAAASSVITGRVATRRTIEPRSLYTESRYAAATQTINGTLTSTARRLLDSSGNRLPALALIIRGDDVARCEDLGRQLRSVRRAVGPDVELLVWGDTAQAAIIGDFLRLERVGRVRVHPIDASDVLGESSRLPTPAVLVLGGGGRVVAGVAHPVRFPNARFRSFAEELAAPLQLVKAGVASN